MILKSSKIFLIIISLIALVLLAVLVLGVYSIRVKNRDASELLNKADEVAEATVLTRFVDNIQTDARVDIESLNNLALSNDKLISLIERVEGAGRTLGLDTKILSVERVEDKKSAEPALFRIAVEAQGSWKGVFSFLNALEGLPHRVMVDEINFVKSEVGWQSRIIVSLPSFD